MRILYLFLKEDEDADCKRSGFVLVLNDKSTQQDAETLVSELVKKIHAEEPSEPVYAGEFLTRLRFEVDKAEIGTVEAVGLLLIKGVR